MHVFSNSFELVCLRNLITSENKMLKSEHCLLLFFVSIPCRKKTQLWKSAAFASLIFHFYATFATWKYVPQVKVTYLTFTCEKWQISGRKVSYFILYFSAELRKITPLKKVTFKCRIWNAEKNATIRKWRIKDLSDVLTKRN